MQQFKWGNRIKIIDEKTRILLSDMADTMYRANGVGLAAPQIGILKRLVVIDIGEGLIKLINPVILEQSGEQQDMEGTDLLARAFCH